LTKCNFRLSVYDRKLIDSLGFFLDLLGGFWFACLMDDLGKLGYVLAVFPCQHAIRKSVFGKSFDRVRVLEASLSIMKCITLDVMHHPSRTSRIQPQSKKSTQAKPVAPI
jgi:hypothetical protein